MYKGTKAINLNNKTNTDGQENADVFKDYFLQHVTQINKIYDNPTNEVVIFQTIDIPVIDDSNAIKAEQRLKVKSSIGADNKANNTSVHFQTCPCPLSIMGHFLMRKHAQMEKIIDPVQY